MKRSLALYINSTYKPCLCDYLLQVVDGLLMTHLEDVNVTPEAFASACERARYVLFFPFY